MREIKLRVYWQHQESDCFGFDYFDAYDGWKDKDPLQEPIALEQFTGLRDKNGKEIYEGDILAGTLGTAGRGSSTRREKPFNFQMMWYRDGWNLSAVDRYCSSTYRWYPNANDCEVIGNIHENLELLK